MDGKGDHARGRGESARTGDGVSAGHSALDKLLAELGMHRTELEIQNEELRRIQTDLEGARDGYQDLFETAPVGYFLLGPRAQILGANLAATHLLDVPREKLINRPFPFFIDPTEAHRFHLHHQEVFEHPGVKRRIELRVRRSNHSFADALIEATCLHTGGQRLCRMALIDVSEQRRAERRLTDRQAYLTAILNTVVDSVITIDDRGIIESVNSGTARMFGFSEAELVGQPIAILMPEPHRARYLFLLRRFLDYGEDSIVGQTREVPAQRRDGSVFPAELTVGELRTEDYRQYVGVVRDVSERRRQDARVRESLNRPHDAAPTPRASAVAGASALPRLALIVDDDPDVAEILRDALEDAGVSARVAHTGREALRLAGTLHPDLVLCDVGLGNGMSGYEVARALRADAGTRDAFLVAVTGLAAEQCGADATAAGFDHVLAKPIDLSMLENVLRHFPGKLSHRSPA